MQVGTVAAGRRLRHLWRFQNRFLPSRGRLSSVHPPNAHNVRLRRLPYRSRREPSRLPSRKPLAARHSNPRIAIWQNRPHGGLSPRHRRWPRPSPVGISAPKPAGSFRKPSQSPAGVGSESRLPEIRPMSPPMTPLQHSSSAVVGAKSAALKWPPLPPFAALEAPRNHAYELVQNGILSAPVGDLARFSPARPATTLPDSDFSHNPPQRTPLR